MTKAPSLGISFMVVSSNVKTVSVKGCADVAIIDACVMIAGVSIVTRQGVSRQSEMGYFKAVYVETRVNGEEGLVLVGFMT